MIQIGNFTVNLKSVSKKRKNEQKHKVMHFVVKGRQQPFCVCKIEVYKVHSCHQKHQTVNESR